MPSVAWQPHCPPPLPLLLEMKRRTSPVRGGPLPSRALDSKDMALNCLSPNAGFYCVPQTYRSSRLISLTTDRNLTGLGLDKGQSLQFTQEDLLMPVVLSESGVFKAVTQVSKRGTHFVTVLKQTQVLRDNADVHATPPRHAGHTGRNQAASLQPLPKDAGSPGPSV